MALGGWQIEWKEKARRGEGGVEWSGGKGSRREGGSGEGEGRRDYCAVNCNLIIL